MHALLQQIYQPVVVGGQRAALSHFPFEGDSHGEDRFVEYRPVDDGVPA